MVGKLIDFRSEPFGVPELQERRVCAVVVLEHLKGWLGNAAVVDGHVVYAKKSLPVKVDMSKIKYYLFSK